MNTKIAEAKQWLKDAAIKIRKTRKEYKDTQRANESSWQLAYRLNDLKHEYRHRHIAYSEMRGRTRDQIERPREGNEPNETLIQKYKGDILQEAAA